MIEGQSSGAKSPRLRYGMVGGEPGRPLDDNAMIMANYKGGAKGVYWNSSIAIGHDNALRLLIYGTKGAAWVDLEKD